MKNLAMHIMDILQNSVRAHATSISVVIEEDTNENYLEISISDNGTGMDDDLVHVATDPFVTTRSTRHVGLGLPLLRQNAERTGGRFSIDSKKDQGTNVVARFIHDHLDRPSNGDFAGAFLLSCVANPEVEFHYRHVKDGTEFLVSTRQFTEALGDIPINDPAVYPYLHEMISENLKKIGVN